MPYAGGRVIHDADAPIMDVIKWTHIYDRIEQAVERVEDLSDIIEGTILKNA